jgi:hypothetical protein
VTLEEAGAHSETDKQFIYNTYTELLKDVVPRPGLTRTESYEATAKERFIKEPTQMKRRSCWWWWTSCSPASTRGLAPASTSTR